MNIVLYRVFQEYFYSSRLLSPRQLAVNTFKKVYFGSDPINKLVENCVLDWKNYPIEYAFDSIRNKILNKFTRGMFDYEKDTWYGLLYEVNILEVQYRTIGDEYFTREDIHNG